MSLTKIFQEGERWVWTVKAHFKTSRKAKSTPSEGAGGIGDLHPHRRSYGCSRQSARCWTQIILNDDCVHTGVQVMLNIRDGSTPWAHIKTECILTVWLFAVQTIGLSSDFNWCVQQFRHSTRALRRGSSTWKYHLYWYASIITACTPRDRLNAHHAPPNLDHAGGRRNVLKLS